MKSTGIHKNTWFSIAWFAQNKWFFIKNVVLSKIMVFHKNHGFAKNHQNYEKSR